MLFPRLSLLLSVILTFVTLFKILAKILECCSEKFKLFFAHMEFFVKVLNSRLAVFLIFLIFSKVSGFYFFKNYAPLRQSYGITLVLFL